jgi:hypothetical protein
MSEPVRHKTYKREIACALILGLSGVVYVGDIEMAKVLVWPIIGFAAAAFGLDAVGGQWKAR